MKKSPSEVGYFGKLSEIFITALAAQTAWKAEFCTTKSLLMQDWVFRLGSRANVQQTAKLLFLKTCCEETKFLKAEIPHSLFLQTIETSTLIT